MGSDIAAAARDVGATSYLVETKGDSQMEGRLKPQRRFRCLNSQCNSWIESFKTSKEISMKKSSINRRLIVLSNLKIKVMRFSQHCNKRMEKSKSKALYETFWSLKRARRDGHMVIKHYTNHRLRRLERIRIERVQYGSSRREGN